jgi:Methyltransferase domain
VQGPSKLHRYLTHGQKRVEGWLPPNAAKMCVAIGAAQQAMGIRGHVAEIGVHHGRLFILLYLMRQAGERGLAVDLFGDQARNPEQSGAGDLAVFLSNLRRHADTESLVVHESDSTELDGATVMRLVGGPCRLISIDGGHTLEITAHDLATAQAALAPGGVIILDDVFNEMWPGVAEGLCRFFSSPRDIVPFATGANKTFFCAPTFAPRYVDALRPLAVKTAERDFLGARVLCCDFAPLTFAERVGQLAIWRAVKDTVPLRIARRLYRRTSGAAGP